MALRSVVEEREPVYVSTGHLPDPETVQALVNEAQRRFQSNRDGAASRVYPRLPVSPAGEPTPEMDRRSALRTLLGSVTLVARPTRRIPVHRRCRLAARRIGAGCVGGIVAAVIAADAGDDQGRRT